MGGISLWGADHFSQVLFGATQSVLDTYYLALINGNEPTSFVSGVELGEVSTGPTGYVRLAIPNVEASWSQDDYTHTTNALDLTFVTATASWDRVSSWALCNSPTEGYVVFYGTFTAPTVVDVGDTFQVAAGGLQLILPAGT